jgi:hypothetical protein
MRLLEYAFGLTSLMCLNVSVCLAQQPIGPATLESLLNSGDDQKPATAEADAAPKRPAGTAARPKDCVQHPDLDKAWANYDAASTKAAEGIRAAINKQFNASAEKGDPDAAKMWQIALEQFEKTGAVPTGREARSAVSAAVLDYKKAKKELTAAYEAVVKALTMEKKIAEAKAVRSELRILSNETIASGSSTKAPVRPRMVDQFVVEALVDGDSELCVTPTGIYWRSLGVAKPGRHGGRNEPTFVNGQPWRPQWGQPNQERGHDETAPLPLAVSDLNIGFEVVAVGRNRGDRGILPRSPVSSRRDSDKFVVTIPDRDFGSVWYTIRFFRIPNP